MEDQHSLFLPLIHGKPTIPLSPNKDDHASHSGINILVRFISVIFIALLSLYANHEASKGFDITILNDAIDSATGRRFDLFYVSNDKATRIILDTSNFVEHLLYPDVQMQNQQQPKKHINHVILRLSSLNMTSNKGIIVHYSPNKENVVLHISPSIMDQANAKHALVTVIRRGMTRVWLWDGASRAPPELIDGMVEYVRMVAEGLHHMKIYGIGTKLPECDKFWWKEKDPEAVAQLLNYYEEHNKGFIQRLNGAMKENWHDRMVDDALGMPLQSLCGSYNFSMNIS